jgi:2-(1,2-epoxy-1,2-dihydrophenyl)acetyl-CoA isomerase
MNAASDLLIEKTPGVATVTLNRPAVKNALTFAMCRELIGFLESLPEDFATRVVVLRGSGTDFCSGADLKDVSGIVVADARERSEAATRQVRELSIPLFLALHAVPQPVVCSVRGYAIGAGMQLALLSDLVVAAQSAKFVLPQVRLGHSVDHGESWALPRRVGSGRAMQLMVLGETLNGSDAERFGVANWVVPDEQLEDKTAEIVQRLAAGPTTAIREMKALLAGASQRSFAEQFDAEARSLGVCAASADFAEAISAFMGKRKPSFTGR